jgi:hypothetical protein
MKQAPWFPKISFIFVLTLFATIEGHTVTDAHTQQFAKPTFCSGPEYRQFDFWLGDWDVFEADKVAAVARTRVDRILDGCVLREDYESTNGLKGQSFSLYDASRRIWHQSWATDPKAPNFKSSIRSGSRLASVTVTYRPHSNE